MPVPDHVKNNPDRNPRMDRAAARAAVSFEFPDATDAELDAALATVDPDALWDDERPKWTNEVWDRQSPINGVPAADVLARRTDIPDTGDVMLIKEDGRVVMFQPHEPGVEGVVEVPPGQGDARGLAMAEGIVADRVRNETARRVIENIRAQRG